MNKKYIGLLVAIVLVVGGGSFWSGYAYGQSKTKSGFPGGAGSMSGRNFGGANGGPSQPRNRSGLGGFISGEVLSKDEKSLTIKLQDGGSRIVLIGGETKVSKSAEGSIADVSIGGAVMVSGKANPDGSLTAETVQLRPNMPRREVQ